MFNINNIILIILSAITTKISSDPRTINMQFNDILKKILIKKIIFNIKKIKNKNIRTIVYNNKVILLGKLEYFKDINLLDNILKNNNKYNLKIYNEIRVNKNKNSFKKDIINIIDYIKINILLLKFNIIKLSQIKVFIENNEIFIIGMSNRKNIIELVRIITFFYNKKKINIAIIHNDFILKKIIF